MVVDLDGRSRHAVVMASRIYTKHGDDGTTGRFLGGRISKAAPLVAACGDVDEAVAVLGMARAECDDADLAELVLRLQRELFVVGADLATNPERRDKLEPGVSIVTEEMTGALEAAIDERLTLRPLQPVFLVPGSTATSALEVVLEDEALHAEMVAGTPLHRLGEPDDIALAVLYLASAASSWVTGKVLEVDGGTEEATRTSRLPDL